MTEHLRKLLEDAAQGARTAKSKIESVDKAITNAQECIESLESSIKASQAMIDYNEELIGTKTGERAIAVLEFEKARQRFAFFTAELVEHPFAAL